MEDAKKRGTIIGYLKESKEEFRKINWPSKQETIRYSLIVIGVSIGMAVYFGILDALFTLGFEKLLDLFH